MLTVPSSHSTGEMPCAQRCALRAVVVALALVLVNLLLLWPRAAIGPQESDGAELAVVAFRGSLAHPPGYPLYSMLASLAVWISPANPYLALAQLSAFFQSLAVGVLALTCIELSGLLCAATFAFVWGLLPASLLAGTDAEVFALHHFLFALSTFFSIKYIRYASWGAYFGLILSLIAGFAHHQFILLALPLAAVALCSTKNRVWIVLAVIILAVASLYGSLFARYQAAPEIAFASLETWQDFIAYLFRFGYGSFSLYLDEAGTGGTVIGDIALILVRFFLLLSVLAISAIWFSLRSKSRQGLALFCMAVLAILVACLLRVPAPEQDYLDWVARFYPSLIMPLVLLAAYGLVSIPLAAWQKRVIALFAAVPALLVAANSLERADLREDRVVEWELARAFDVPKDSLVVLSSDRLVFGAMYAQEVRGLRRDVLVVAEGMLGNRNYLKTLRAKLQARGIDSSSAELSLGSLVDVLSRRGNAIFAEKDIPVPSAFEASAWGVLSRWAPPGSIPQQYAVLPCQGLGCGDSDFERSCQSVAAFLSPSRQRSRALLKEHCPAL